MRTLVLMLVLLNLGFFLWQWQNPLPVADRSRLFAQPEGESQAQLITGQAVPDVAETSPFLSSAPVASMVAAAPVEPEVPEVESEVVAEPEPELEPELEQGQELFYRQSG